MSGFGRNLLSGSPFLFWALAPFLVLGALAISLPPDYRDGYHLAAVIACDVTLALLAASLWPYHRSSVARRLLTGWVGLLFTLYALDAAFPGLLPARGEPSSRVNAFAGFLVVGVPCWKYALLGRFSFVPDPIEMPLDEPLLLEAYARAQEALPRLVEAFPDGCREGAFLRFRFTTDEEVVEHLWGQVLVLEPQRAVVAVLTQPLTHSEPLGEVEVPLAEAEDFEFEGADGRLVGGFTTRAMATYADREGLDVPREIRKRLERYADAA